MWEPIDTCQHDQGQSSVTPVNPALRQDPISISDPWMTKTQLPNLDIKYLMFGQDSVQSPEYEAANLPPYNGGKSNLLQHFLL